MKYLFQFLHVLEVVGRISLGVMVPFATLVLIKVVAESVVETTGVRPVVWVAFVAMLYVEYLIFASSFRTKKKKEVSYGLQCPSCGSTNVGRVDEEMVRCVTCGVKTDWYEAHKQYVNHPKDGVELNA